MLLLWLYVISQVIISNGRCQLFHWLFGLTINANVSRFSYSGFASENRTWLRLEFRFEITEVTSVELYRNDFGIDTIEIHSAV